MLFMFNNTCLTNMDGLELNVLLYGEQKAGKLAFLSPYLVQHNPLGSVLHEDQTICFGVNEQDSA
jgi:hypothetical protein